MLRRQGWMFLILLMPFIFSSCFEVIEEINMRADGSGDMTITLNLSQSKTKVASILLMDSINGYKVPSKQEIQKEMNEAVARLKKQPGISNVKSSLDFSKYIGSISFTFKDVSYVNNITRDLLAAQKIKATNVSVYHYNKSSKTFSRQYQYQAAAKSEFGKLKQADKDVFKTATYTSIYRFPAPIKASSNTLAKKSKSGKAVMQQCSVMDLINGRVSVSNNIQLTN